MSFLDDVGEFFSDFFREFFQNVVENGGNVLLAAVGAAIEAAEDAFEGEEKAGAKKKDFAFSNIVAVLNEANVPTNKATLATVVSGLIEIGVTSLNKKKEGAE